MDSQPSSAVDQDSPQKFLNALAENYLLQDAILNATDLTVISTRTDGTISSINKAGEPMLGYKAEELIGREKLTVFYDKKEIEAFQKNLSGTRIAVENADEALVALAKNRIKDHHEWSYHRKDGSVFPAKVSMTGIWNEEAKLIGFLAIIEDITQDKKNELVRHKSQQALEHSKLNLEALTHELRNQNHQLNEFAHIISHNLRSPVGNIGALLSLLNTDSKLSDYKEIFEKLRSASNSLQETLNDLMETMMVKEKSQALRVTLSFQEVFDKIKAGFSGEILKYSAVVTTNFDASPTIDYSKTYLESIFLNLLSNAIKYQSPKRTLRVHFETFVENSHQVLRVTDNALGIDLERYGHQLFTLRKTFHEHKDARGVGLFLTKTQVETMGGTIGAESETDKGSTFTIRFSMR